MSHESKVYAPHQHRVLEERAELRSKIDKLDAFLHADFFHSLPNDDQQLLFLQFNHMSDYEDILIKRIARF